MAALKEMCFAGEGVLFNPAVGFELLRTAAERGDAEAQAYLGFRLAMGIYPPLPGTQHQFTLEQTAQVHTCLLLMATACADAISRLERDDLSSYVLRSRAIWKRICNGPCSSPGS